MKPDRSVFRAIKAKQRRDHFRAIKVCIDQPVKGRLCGEVVRGGRCMAHWNARGDRPQVAA